MPPAKKRKITSAPVKPVKQVRTSPKHQVFTEWSEQRGVKIHNVKPLARHGRGVGLVVTGKLKKGDQILFVPAKAMIKPDVPLLKRLDLAQSASPHVQLTISLMETMLPENSPMKDWEATWPTRKDFHDTMPLFWSSKTRDEMPKSTRQPLERQIADFEKDRSAVAQCLSTKNWQMDDFEYYWAIVNTRSFHFKPPGNRPGYMVLCPFIDYLNHAPTGSSVEINQSEDGFEVTADRDYKAGEEVFASYGAHPNDKLLIHYGFICATDEVESSSVDDDIRLDHVILPRIPQNIKDQLQDVGYLGGYYLSPTTLEICFKTQAAIRAVLLTATEWEYFIGSGEDLGADQTEKVMDWLTEPINEFMREAAQRFGMLSSKAPVGGGEWENPVAIGLLMKRWGQLTKGLLQFQDAHCPPPGVKKLSKKFKKTKSG